MKSNRVILNLMAHPDDAELLTAGTLSLLGQKGYEIHIATMTAGDCGSVEAQPQQIMRIRRHEAGRAAAMIGAQYRSVGVRDVRIFDDEATLYKVVDLIREVRPFLVITHNPEDYMPDHIHTAWSAWRASFSALMPNLQATFSRTTHPLDDTPYFYYAAPLGHSDIDGELVKMSFYVDITSTIGKKTTMLECHESQAAWLKGHHKMEGPVAFMREHAAEYGKLCGVEYAEGFRQHRQHGWKKDNILAQILGQLVHTGKEEPGGGYQSLPA